MDTSVGEGALPQGWVEFLNIRNKYFLDMPLWEIKNGKYYINNDGISNLDIAIRNWTQIIPPESNYYIWASAKYTALDIIINAIFQRIFAFNKQISDAESINEKTQLEEEIKKILNDITVLKKANKELTTVSEKITKLSEQVKRDAEAEARYERAAARAGKRIRTNQ